MRVCEAVFGVCLAPRAIWGQTMKEGIVSG
jgi:hypothetical protein